MKALLCAFVLTLSGLAHGGPGREALDGFLEGLDTMQARFEQSVLDTGNATLGQMHGSFALQRPGRFRWDYDRPQRQVIMADGRDLWIIEDQLKQVTRYLQRSALRGTPAAFLISDAAVEDDFEIVEIGERIGLQWLELIPRDTQGQLNRVLLAFAGAELRHLELTDKFGQISRFRFFDVERNQPLDPQLFVYQGEDDWDLLHGN